MVVDVSECTSELGDLEERQIKTLEDWIRKFEAKYPVVGHMAKHS
jgi:membrane-associated progesterone receptor component